MKFKIEPEDGGYFFTIKEVPIFKTHTDRGYICDDQWMRDAIRNHQKDKENDWLPVVIIGHNRKHLGEKEAIGFVDNLKYDEKKGILYADLVHIPAEYKEKILKNAYPSRSVEVLPKSRRILAVALLGGTAPHFALPQMRYSHKEKSVWIPYEESDEMENKEEFDERTATIAYEAARQAVEDALAEDEGVEVYELTPDEAYELYEEYGDELEFFEDPVTGEVYTIGEDGVYYAWPRAVWSAIKRAARATGRGISRGAKAVGRGVAAAGRGIGRGAAWTGRKIGGGAAAAGRGVAAAGRAAGRGVGRATLRVAGVHPAFWDFLSTKQKAAILGTVGALAGSVPASYIAGRYVGRKKGLSRSRGIGRVARAIGLGAATLAAPIPTAAFLAGRMRGAAERRQRHELDEIPEYYEEDYPEFYLDMETGQVLDYDGNEVGVVVPTAPDSPEDLPSSPKPVNPNLKINPEDVGEEADEETGLENPVGEPETDLIEELEPRETAEGIEASELFEDPVNYELQRKVEKLERANELQKAARRREHYESYLKEKKAQGYPVGDIEATVDYLMSLTEEQAEQYMQLLERQPRIPLGKTPDRVQSYEIGEAIEEAESDYERNKEVYEAMGVTPEDLQAAAWVRNGPSFRSA